LSFLPSRFRFNFGAEMKPLRIGLIGYDGVQALDLIGPSDAFTIAVAEDEIGKPRLALHERRYNSRTAASNLSTSSSVV
jgi:hypothetical protein